MKVSIMNEIIDISGNCKSTLMADHILEITGLGLFCDICSKSGYKC